MPVLCPAHYTGRVSEIQNRDVRFPRSVFGVGHEPDPRFTLANERTFLAWIRTSLALIAGGVALEAFNLPLPEALAKAVSAVMLGAAVVLPVLAWVHWAAVERAMRLGKPLPASPVLPALVVLIAGVAVALLIGEL